MKTDGWEELAEKVGKKLIEKGLGKWEMGTQVQERTVYRFPNPALTLSLLHF